MSTPSDHEQLFRLALEEAPIGIAVVGLDGRFLRVNHALCEIVQYSEAELTQLTFQAITHPDDLDKDVALARQLERGEIPRYQLEKRYIRKDRSEVTILLHGSVAREPDGTPLYFIAHIEDISERKRSVDRLRQLQERYDLALRGADLAVWDWNVATGEIAFSARWAEMRGYGFEELEPHVNTWIGGLHPDDLPRVQRELNDYFAGTTREYESEHRVRTKQGGWVWILDRGKIFARDARGRPTRMVGTELDITGRKQAEQALQLSEARAAGILAASADAIVSVDDNYRITMFNSGAEQIFGYTKEAVVGRTLDLLIPERLRARHRDHFRRFAESPATSRRMGERRLDIRGRRKNGDEFPADAAISKIEIGGARVLTVSLRDISEQVRVEQEQRFLADAGATLAASLDYDETLGRIAQLAVQDLADICIIDIVEETGEVRRLEVASLDPHMASACTRLKEVHLDRTRPHFSLAALVTKRSQLIAHMTEPLLASLAQSEEHLELLRTLSPGSVISVPLLRRDKLFGVLVLLSSRTSRSYDERDVQFAEELARRAAISIENARLYRSAQQAIRARDDVLAIVAHDLRNPLATVRLQGQVLSSYPDNPDETRLGGQRIERATKRMERLIEDLLDVSRLDRGRLEVEPRRLSASEILHDLAESQRPLADRSAIRLEVRDDARGVQVWADPSRIVQVLENLVGNALKFTPSGGRIEVSATAHGNVVEFSVADSGIGMTPEAARHVFDRFWQVRADRRGAGLGLAIAKGIVEAHQGEISVETEAGRGTRFRFTIPVARTAAKAADAQGADTAR